MTIPEVQKEVANAWTDSYSPAATEHAMHSMRDDPIPYRISHFIARMFFRGIYYPQKGAWGWIRLIWQNRRAIYGLIHASYTDWPGGKRGDTNLEFDSPRRRNPVDVSGD